MTEPTSVHTRVGLEGHREEFLRLLDLHEMAAVTWDRDVVGRHDYVWQDAYYRVEIEGSLCPATFVRTYVRIYGHPEGHERDWDHQVCAVFGDRKDGSVGWELRFQAPNGRLMP